MKRGKVIGAVVLVGAIVLLIAQLLGGQADDITTGNTGVGDGAASAVQSVLIAAGLDEGQSRTYAIDNAESEVYWRIYRSGLFAAAAHSHVISISELTGEITLGGAVAAVQWNLSFPVESLVIDDPDLRARYGEEFESVPSENDKAGTRRNMMTDRVLNGEVFTAISLSGADLTGTLESAALPVSIQMLGRTIDQSFPATVTVDADTVTVTGEYRLTHEDLGMEPFSAFGGAIAVGDEIDFTYRIHAVAGGQ